MSLEDKMNDISSNNYLASVRRVVCVPVFATCVGYTTSVGVLLGYMRNCSVASRKMDSAHSQLVSC